MVKFYPPDYHLQNKVGSKDLTAMFSSEVMATTDAIIAQATPRFAAGCVEQMPHVQQAYQALKDNGHNAANLPTLLNEVNNTLYLLQNLALNSEYSLVVALTKSLITLLEQSPPLTTKTLMIIEWHIHSIASILASNIKGNGGVVGQTIIAELAKLRPAE
jgi:hypothetical protein